MDDSLQWLARTQAIFATAGLVCAGTGQALAPRDLSSLTYTLSGAFLAFVLYASKQLSRGTRRGVLLSLIAQAAQVLHLNFSGLAILFLAGPFIEFGASPSIVLVSAGAGAVGYVAPGSPSNFLPGARLDVHIGYLLDTLAPHPTIAMGINAVALVFAVRLWKTWRTLNERDRYPTAMPAA